MEEKKLNYSAMEVLDERLSNREDGEQLKKELKILVETKNFVLTGYKRTDGIINLDVTRAIKDGRYIDVEVEIDQDYKGKIEKAKVNWSALGSIEPKEAREYAQLISDASVFAEYITNRDFSNKL